MVEDTVVPITRASPPPLIEVAPEGLRLPRITIFDDRPEAAFCADPIFARPHVMPSRKRTTRPFAMRAMAVEIGRQIKRPRSATPV